MPRISEERVLDVGGGQLLVLLLVLEAEHNAARGFILQRMLHSRNHGGVHMVPVSKNRVERRPRERRAKFLLRHIAERVVIAVEEPAEFGMEGLITGGELAQDKGLKKPGGVGKMPLHRAGLRTRLHHHVLRRQRTAKLAGSVANSLVTGEQRRCGGGFCSQAHRILGEEIANGDVMPDETRKLPKKVTGSASILRQLASQRVSELAS